MEKQSLIVKHLKEEQIAWFAARTRRGHELSVRNRLRELGEEHFIPTKMTFRIRNHRRREVEIPLIPNLIFIRATKSRACTLANSGLPIFYMIDYNTHTLLEVPDKQMKDFMRVLDCSPNSLCLSEYPLYVGGRVCIQKGELAGVEGELLSLSTRTYVLVQVGGLLTAKVQVPKNYLIALP